MTTSSQDDDLKEGDSYQSPFSFVHKDNIKLGSALVLSSAFFLTCMGVAAKFLSETHHPIEIAFYRNFMVLIGFTLYLTVSKKWHIIKTNRCSAHFKRGFIGTLGLVCGFWSISFLPLATATTLYYMAPLMIVLLSVPMLKERVGLPRYLAVLVGFLGVVLVVNPSGQDVIMIGFVFAFFDAFFSALTQIFLRDLGKTENPLTTVFYYMLIGTIVTALALPFVWTGMPQTENILLLLVLGLAGGLQQFTKTKGYGLAPVAITSPLTYTGVVWAVFLGWVFWDSLPTISVLLGASIIIASNLFILWRERKIKSA